MRKLLSLATSLLVAGTVSAMAAEKSSANTTPPAQRSMESMTAGSHMMPGQKHSHMSDRVMPARSRHCTEEALAKMPPDHRAACGK